MSETELTTTEATALDGTTDVAIVGNLFASVRPKAVAVGAQPSERVLFSDNVLADTESEHDKLVKSVIAGNLR